MQLGTRWFTGAAPHLSVPSELHDAIAEQEAAFPSASAWTLTWLEGRPRCELDSFVLVTLSADGDVVVSNLNKSSPPTGIVDDDGDDDWLN
ncbi:MAG: Fe-S oxidoreductase [Leucobacter sp.]